MRNGNDWEGLTDRFDSERQEAEAEQQYAISEILDMVDRDEPLTSGQKLLLHWFCGVPIPNPSESQMSVWAPEDM